jgi:hypothetical protein
MKGMKSRSLIHLDPLVLVPFPWPSRMATDQLRVGDRVVALIHRDKRSLERAGSAGDVAEDDIGNFVRVDVVRVLEKAATADLRDQRCFACMYSSYGSHSPPRGG